MIERTLAIMRKEFLHIFRDRNTLVLIFAIPAIQMVMLGYVANTNVQNIAIAVWDQDQTIITTRLIETVNETDYFDVTEHVGSEGRILDLMDAGRIRAALIIPEGFAASFSSNQPHELELVIDGSDPMVANTILAAALRTTQGQTSPVPPMGAARPSGLKITPRVLYNPDLKSANFMIPALMGLILQFLATLLTAVAIVREREHGTMEQLIATPIRPAELVLGKTTPYVLVTFFDLLEVLLVGVFWFGVPIQGSVWLLLALSILFLVGALGVGILISAATNTQQEAMLMSFMVILPSIFLSGFLFPLEAMPAALHVLSYLVPLRYMLIIIRGIVLKGVGLSVLRTEVLILAIFSTLVLILASRRFRKSLD